nr:hydrogenase expression protein HypF [Streptomyces sp. TP-A0874]
MLARMQMPAGKAMALAAMPTAVLMAMGLTPQLAQADPQIKGPFKPGPCVTRPDEGEPDAEKKEDKGEKDGEDQEDGESGGGRPAPRKPAKPSPGPGTGTDRTEQPAAPEPAEPSPSPNKTRNPLDPLGLGEKLKELLGGGAAEAPEPEASPTAPDSGSSGQESEPARGATTGGGSTEEGSGKDASSTEDSGKPAGKAAEKQKEPASAEEREKDGGLEPFPCPEYDAEALKNAELETPPSGSLFPDAPWRLHSTKLTLHGLDYKGIVKVKTYSGEVKDVLKFTASGIDIRDLHQLVEGPDGTTTHVEAGAGTTSTFRNGTVTMYTEQLKGNLLGIVPITFSPTSPPPLNIPEVFFTNVEVVQAGQFGGELTMPGMHLHQTRD